ncbi:hypothetical protein SAMN05192558_104120 [Actinokineospora alba]|uniref:Uncharacterized protein n=1 Tax=Actinokineospora alba TaxID=504798 RepID=A0A1H0LEX6_9PSEU|nr:hypothetical protein [Actinokineospora alba]TDP67301.1 hypothetical protein C8E96_2839 [Actinokineospora alba]SDJ01145.1 hypothetical protein SAMN05421871_109177 [Actinokineospora alba]SDO66655.1 hypothetical protein SAMN05192558_104120 [Actinokineospora alba]
MDWPSLLVGALAGGMVGIVMQNVLFPVAERRWQSRRHRAFYIKANRAWSQVEQLHPRLVLVQAGWDHESCFPEGSVVLRLEGNFELTNAATIANRAAHSDEWTAAGYTDGEQIGIASISTTRISDEPSDEFKGRAHRLTLTVHRYHYFDFLATHMLRLLGTVEERKVLDSIAGAANPDRPAPGFPTPCSVGLSMFCEGGTHLLTPRRSSSTGPAGWEGGKFFNAVGENAALRDFAAANRQLHETTPDVVARRGLYEENGLL